MRKNKTLIILFIATAIIQLYVPARIILNRETILDAGKEYKFKTAPVDPNDPFRGKYMTLDFEANVFRIREKAEWQAGQTVFVLLSNHEDGYAAIQSVSKEEPVEITGYVRATIDYISYDSLLHIKYPFNRYYMEESKAAKAEAVYRKANRDSNSVTYALVRVKNGEAVLKDVVVNDISIDKAIQAEEK